MRPLDTTISGEGKKALWIVLWAAELIDATVEKAKEKMEPRSITSVAIGRKSSIWAARALQDLGSRRHHLEAFL